MMRKVRLVIDAVMSDLLLPFQLGFDQTVPMVCGVNRFQLYVDRLSAMKVWWKFD